MNRKLLVLVLLCSSLLVSAYCSAGPAGEPDPRAFLDAWQNADNVPPLNAPLPMDKIRTIVFISLGMPKPALSGLLEQGSERSDVLFVLRGWQPPDITSLYAQVYRLMPVGRPANVVINPVWFREYEIDAVPVFLSKTDDGHWYRVSGEIAIEGAEKMVRNGRAARTTDPVGPLYPVSEPDILALIEERIKTFDWETMVQKARSRAEDKLRGEFVRLPKAHAASVHYYDPSIRVTEDVVAPDGTLLAAKGTVINPFDYVALSNSYIVFDPHDSDQVEVVRQRITDTPTITLLATQDLYKANELFPRMRVYPCMPLIATRLGIKAVPAIVRQQGRRLEVTYVPVR
ncbi:conjugal transfer pilus assembly protein TraW [Desulfacinum hydrothermale DSM 13146]|uniref:Conjugal transfer pilus assembly protein TraW n=1 Tax=Desulfacinum hydrothermale DSM 13146 TaxID=1121390 RepID=A0A1W1XWH4_9BACT|nr:TrbC family F-type conjugative pilus assembly protein [Desulfacinum hydrothermale]SMC28319.1 conjugal transfer pilus assembly protein TraW [Desulfacinum hydrothermale DSM 13146]